VLSFTEEMSRRGMAADSQTLLLRMEQAGVGAARALGITEGDAVVHWRRLRLADGAAVGIEDSYLNEVLLPGFLQGAVPTSLYDELRSRGLRPGWVDDLLAADVAGADEAEVLGVPAGTVVLRKQRRALVGDTVVEVSRSVYRADRYTLRVSLGAAG
jgi:GntR family transcriptional regulator